MDLTDPDDPRIMAALNRSCDICRAPVGQPCTNPIRPGHPLPGRLVHLGRLEDR